MRLSRSERQIEAALVKGEYVDAAPSDVEAIAHAIAHRRKDAVLNLRVNSQDLKVIKARAKRYGIKYQTLISECLHRLAQS
jgi:predicted DNA binding CopG/RHH family protein